MPELDDYMVDLDDNSFDDGLEYFEDDFTDFADLPFELDGNLQYVE